VKTADYNYDLPSELIAQNPLVNRSASRLMILKRQEKRLFHHHFYEIGKFFRPGDVLVLNNSKVIPARLYGVKADNGGKVEFLLLRNSNSGKWEALAKPAKRLKEGSCVIFGEGRLFAKVLRVLAGGIVTLDFENEHLLFEFGTIPLPPYIKSPLKNPERYQTVFATKDGSVAAPTAGLHFTPELLKGLNKNGVEILYITLHISLDTFRSVVVDDPLQHKVYREYGIVDKKTSLIINQSKSEGRRIIAAGTSTVRLLEEVAMRQPEKTVEPFSDWCEHLIFPGHKFKIVDALITNFHLPRSTLLMLVSAFAGHKLLFNAYAQAIKLKYRFYSFGDAMFIV
jgi:S-adenosylmethionine:tRNA ribosyltransferase-isomerase